VVRAGRLQPLDFRSDGRDGPGRSAARVLSSAARKDAGLFVLPGKMVPLSYHMAEIILVFLLAKLI
jgi:hypothetical protein